MKLDYLPPVCDRISINAESAVRISASWILLLLLSLPAAVQAQFAFKTNNGAITITRYTGSGGAVVIPSTTNGLPVTSIAAGAFGTVAGGGIDSKFSVTIPYTITNIAFQEFTFSPGLTSITVDTNNPMYSSVAGVLFDKSQTTLIQYPVAIAGSYTVPDTVASIASLAFSSSSGLTNVTIPHSVISIGTYAFCYCASLASVTLGNGLANIAQDAFAYCASLTSVTIPNSITNIGGSAFAICTSLTGIYFQGNAPSVGPDVFYKNANATVYYLPGTTGWGPTLAARPTALWNPQFQTVDPTFGVQNNQFGFTITGTTNIPIVLEASANLASPSWTSLQNCTLTNGSIYFSDPAWTNYSSRFYRIRSP